MRILIQKVREASVIINGEVHSNINKGFVALVGFSTLDSEEIVDKMISKFINLRILEDDAGKTNNSIMSKNLEVLSVSQFTLYADTKKGRRPSFSKSAKSEEAKKLYEYFNKNLNKEIPIKTGVFQEDMQVHLVNDGPFTIMLDSEEYGWHK